jgi:membrane-associated phospholipid phosphatase
MTSSVALPPLVPDTGSRRVPVIVQPRLTALLATALAAGTVALLTILAVTGMRLATEFANFVLLALLVAGLAGFSHWRRHPWRLTDSAAIVSMATLSLLLCGLISCTALRLGLPLADGFLARGDALVGIDVAAVSRFVATSPALSSLLHVAYNSSGLLCVAAIAWNLLAKDRLLMWQAVATIVVAMQVTAIVSILFPAQGASVALGLGALQGSGLPYGAGTYSATEFGHFYFGSETLVTREDINGIVCFPSFHTVLALVILQGFVNSWLKWLALPWSALTIVSTVPMGGHYAIDLAGGLLVWIVASRLAIWACRFPESPPEAAA